MSDTRKAYEGHIDGVKNGFVFGWASSAYFSDEPITVRLHVDVYQSAILADLYRADLEKPGKETGATLSKLECRTDIAAAKFKQTCSYQDSLLALIYTKRSAREAVYLAGLQYS